MRVSLRSGCSPAATVRPSASSGAAQGAAPCAGFGAGSTTVAAVAASSNRPVKTVTLRMRTRAERRAAALPIVPIRPSFGRSSILSVIPPALVREPRRRIRLVPNDSIAREPRQQCWSWSSSASRHQTSGALAPFVCARAHEGGARSDAAHKWPNDRDGGERALLEPCGMLGRKPLRGLGSRRRRSPCVAARRAHRSALGARIPPGPSPEHVRVPQRPPPAGRAFDDRSGQRWRASSVVRRGISATDRTGCGPSCSAPTTGSSPPRAW